MRDIYSMKYSSTKSFIASAVNDIAIFLHWLSLYSCLLSRQPIDVVCLSKGTPFRHAAEFNYQKERRADGILLLPKLLMITLPLPLV